MPQSQLLRTLPFRLSFLLSLIVFFSLCLSVAEASFAQEVLLEPKSLNCECPFTPTPQHPSPGKLPFNINETTHYYEHHVNGSENGLYRRSSCPAINVLANRGYLPRSGRQITAEEIINAVAKVYNFGIDNIVIVVWPTFAVHAPSTRIDLDWFNDDKVQHLINCPTAPTRNDRTVGENVNINMTLFESLLSFSKNGETLTLEDLAEHHHLRHNQSKAEDPNFRFGNRDAVCSLAQYSNLVGTLGRLGPDGSTTLFVDDVRTFYVDEDLPASYQRRELPFYSAEANAYVDRMRHHIGFKIERPFPPGDGDGRDIEPEVANYERGG